jgi:hypothetical protein
MPGTSENVIVVAYDPALTLREGRALYFERNGIPADGGYGKRWVKVTRNHLPLYLLNTAPRRRAVPYHDLHHVLTEYDTSNTGEAEISAWEIAAGTWPHWFALFIDLAGLAVGLVIAPLRTFQAFARGRRCRSLYAEPLGDELLSSPIGATRRRLGIAAVQCRATAVDAVLFVSTSILALSTLALLVFFLPVFVLIGWFWQ